MFKRLAVVILLLLPVISMADTANCHGKFLNPISDINWTMVFPISIAGVRVDMPDESPESPLGRASPMCVCPSHFGGWPSPGFMVTFHEPMFIEEISRDPGCFSTIGGVKALGGFDSEATDMKEDTDNSSRWEVHWYAYPVFKILQIFQDLICASSHGFALTYVSEVDPTWQNDEWGAVFSPESVIFANPLAQSACMVDAVTSTFNYSLDPLFWCAGSWGGVYPFTGNANASQGRIQSAELVGAKAIARLAREGMLWDTVGPWAMCSPVPNPIWVKSEFSVDPVYPMISHGYGLAIGASPTVRMLLPPQSYPSFENISQVIFQEQQCCIRF